MTKVPDRLSANLTLPDYGRVARRSFAVDGNLQMELHASHNGSSDSLRDLANQALANWGT
jgi:hypothetical protein